MGSTLTASIPYENAFNGCRIVFQRRKVIEKWAINGVADVINFQLPKAKIVAKGGMGDKN